MNIVYLVSLVVLVQQIFLSSTAFILGSLLGLFGVPSGYRAYAAELASLPLLFIIVIKTPREARKSFLTIGMFWLPWLIYLAIRGWSTPEGLWKLQTHLIATFMPAVFIGLIAASKPQLFEKYFIPCLIALNVLAVMVIWSGLFSDYFKTMDHAIQSFDRNIIFSRSLGIILIYMLVTSAWVKNPFIAIPSMIAIFGFMIMIGSRGPVVSVLMTTVIYTIIMYRKDIVKLMAICIIGVLLISAFVFSDVLKESVASFSKHGKELKMNKYFGQDRFATYEPTLKIFAEHPLLGLGLGQWWPEYRKRFVDRYSSLHTEARLNKIKTGLDYAYPHNILLEILTELGLVGVVLFALLFLPYKRFFDISNKYNFLCLLGIFYACASNDLAVGNAAIFVFSTLSVLYSRKLLPHSQNNDVPEEVAMIPAGKLRAL